MCLLAVFFRVGEDAPLIVGANREEFYARGGEPPRFSMAPSAPSPASIRPRAAPGLV